MEYESESVTCRIICGKYILFYFVHLKALLAAKIVASVGCIFAINVKNMQRDDGKETPHTEKYDCRCSNCQKKFGGLGLLAQAIEQSQNEPGPSTSQEPSTSRRVLNKCLYCDKTFTHRGDYNKHVRTHTKEQPFQCTVCDRKFSNASNLSRHSKLHSGDRPFTCENCNKNFSRKDKLDLHRNSKSCKKTS